MWDCSGISLPENIYSAKSAPLSDFETFKQRQNNQQNKKEQQATKKSRGLKKNKVLSVYTAVYGFDFVFVPKQMMIRLTKPSGLNFGQF